MPFASWWTTSHTLISRPSSLSLSLSHPQLNAQYSCDGKWIRPCTAIVPPDAQNLVVMVKEIKSKKTTSSGKFFSVRSFLMGFWTNVVGMVGFAKSRRLAKQSWDERQEYEQLIKQRALEKKLARSSQQQGQQQPPNNHNNNNNLKP